MKKNQATSRRDFLKGTAAAGVGAAIASQLSVARTAHAAGSDQIKIALVGCGGRGTGAASHLMNAGKDDKSVKLIAVADAFENQSGSRSSKDLRSRILDRSTFRKSGCSSVWTPTRTP